MDPENPEVQAAPREVLNLKRLPVQADSEVSNPSAKPGCPVQTPFSFKAWGICRVAIAITITIPTIYTLYRGRPLSTVKKFGRTSRMLSFVMSLDKKFY